MNNNNLQHLIGNIVYIYDDFLKEKIYYEIKDVSNNMLTMDRLPAKYKSDDAVEVHTILEKYRDDLWGMKYSVAVPRKRRKRQ